MKETLRRLLSPATTSGTVTGLRNGVAEIATARGRIEAVAPAGISIGDTVQIDNGVVVRINHPVGTTETYFV